MRPCMPRRLSPAAARTNASSSDAPESKDLTRVSTLPRMRCSTMSGRMMFTSAARRGLPVATIDPLGNSSRVVPSFEITASRGSSR